MHIPGREQKSPQRSTRTGGFCMTGPDRQFRPLGTRFSSALAMPPDESEDIAVPMGALPEQENFMRAPLLQPQQGAAPSIGWSDF